MKALIFVETKDESPVSASLELFAAAKELGADITAVSVKEQDGVLTEDLAARALSEQAKAGGYDVVLLAATSLGKLVTPRVAARTGGGSVNDVIEIKKEDGRITVVRPVYGGTIRQKIGISAVPAVVSVRGGSYEAPAEVPAAAVLEADSGEIRTKVLELIREAGEMVNLEDAGIIVAGGRGMGDKEGFGLCAALAEAMGGVVGATRPAIENGWISRTHQVGQSGKIVRPDIYVACGISGATQHVSGMIGSKYIIAINKDEDAPIFSIADLGIVGDVKQIIPLMIEALKEK